MGKRNSNCTLKMALLNAFKEHIGEWVCIDCAISSSQPAAIFREVKRLGYEFDEVSTNRWGTSKFCPCCGRKTTHYRMLSIEPLVVKKTRFTITPSEKHRIVSLLNGRDAFSGASISSVIEVDHKVPYLRLSDDIDISTLNDKGITTHFQLLTPAHNILKDRKCRECVITGKRPPFFGVKFWYEGNEKYRGSCVGCGWYDAKSWQDALNAKLGR
jgi:hypothetical protein